MHPFLLEFGRFKMPTYGFISLCALAVAIVLIRRYARIEGLDPGESDAILEQLYEIGERRENIFEHVWQLGDFLMWDNRCTIHARTDFPKGERRLLRRCTVEGGELRE